MLALVTAEDFQKNKQIAKKRINIQANGLLINDFLMDVNKIAIWKLLIAISPEKLLPYYCSGDLFFFFSRFDARLF